MKKRILAFFLSSIMAFSMAACGGSSADKSNNESGEGEEGVSKLVVAIRTFGTTPADLEEVQEKVNEITREKIDVEIEMMIIPSGSYQQQMTLMLSGDEQLDVMGAPSMLIPSACASEQLKPLDDLLEEHGQGIKETLGEELLSCGEFEGQMYCVPIMCDQVTGMGGFILRKDICEKYNIDVETIDSYEKLGEVFEMVHEKEPNMTILSPYSVGQSPLMFNSTWDKLGDYFGVLEDYGQSMEVVNLFETDAYRQYLDVFHDWYEKGYISSDVTNATEAGAALMKAGNLFAYTQCGKPGIEIQEKNSSGYEVEYCQVLESLNVTKDQWQWTIPENSVNPEKAMEFLNLMYTEPEITNLLAYGIEDKHYIKMEDGTIGYPDGVDAANSGYNMGNMVWSLGNEFHAYIWNGNDPDVWEQTIEWNKTGMKSKAFGFRFNNVSVSNEIAAVQNVYDQYRMSLECGVSDPNEVLDEMNEKLYAAGLQTIIDEKQKQLDKWASENGVE